MNQITKPKEETLACEDCGKQITKSNMKKNLNTHLRKGQINSREAEAEAKAPPQTQEPQLPAKKKLEH